jgi:hypothetical protein
MKRAGQGKKAAENFSTVDPLLSAAEEAGAATQLALIGANQ